MSKQVRYCANEGKNEKAVNTRPTLSYDELNRPFTDDTPHLVRRWHDEQGNSFEEIAMILNRSVENVKEAYNKGATWKGVMYG